MSGKATKVAEKNKPSIEGGEKKIMDLSSISFSRKSLPADMITTNRGTTPKVIVTEKGQIRFNVLATKHFGVSKDSGSKLYFQGGVGRTLFVGVKPFKGQTADDFVATLSYNEKAGQAYAGVAPFFRLAGYDYIKSGNQSFDLSLSKAGTYSFELPEGNLTPKPVVPRTKKVKGEKVAPTATANAVAELEPELVA